MEWDTTLYEDKHAFVFDYGNSLISLLNPQPGERILDVGCGTGELTYEISKLGAEVKGIDLSEDMIKRAKEKYPNVPFSTKDAAHFHFKHAFDAIFSNAALHWVKNYQGAIKSMYSSLKHGGRIVLEFGGKGNVDTIIRQLKTELKRADYDQAAALEPWYFPSIGEYAAELEKEGFEVTLAQLYERPTQLADQEKGIEDWITMFGKVFFEGINKVEQIQIAKKVQQGVFHQLFHDDQWYADYKRIRVVAVKK
ncbi:class I SAM-dependent methyltransferase [Fulvivirga sediminis]|uniref:Methyltransferase domain-containing protein n=1 Tax=Fulvivirga sediminis TaxID=2803949 RepID=A0A937K0S0_9BACT|nr:class I SAM-dependent methyltransferase [Fulvivirga sediminis]MBL3658628.1 methyltransferase domain-containing protein [Fulvivirga sediminis]